MGKTASGAMAVVWLEALNNSIQEIVMQIISLFACLVMLPVIAHGQMPKNPDAWNPSDRSLESLFNRYCIEQAARTDAIITGSQQPSNNGESLKLLVLAGDKIAPVLTNAIRVVPASASAVRTKYQKFRNSLPSAVRDRLPLVLNPTLIRQTASEIFITNRSAAKVSIESLIESLNDPDDFVRHNCVKALAQINRNNPEIDRALVRACSDTSGFVRNIAAVALEYTARRSEEVRSAVEKARNAADAFSQQELEDGPKHLGIILAEAETIDERIQDLDHLSEARRLATIKALGAQRDEPTKSVPALLICLNDNAEKIRVAAVTALKRYDREARLKTISTLASDARGYSTTVPLLTNFLQDSDPEIRKAAASAIASFGRSAERARPILKEYLRDSDPTVASAVQEALTAIEAAISSGR